jgi:MFS family permease
VETVFLSTERPRPDWLREHPRAWIAAVATVCFGAFMGQLDASVVALTYHRIGTDFRASLSTVQWVSLSYLIALALLLIPLGGISDRLGRKRLYLWGFALFGASSLACALAPGLWPLVGLRAVQGIGAAMLQANSVALVTTSVPRERMRFALGIQAAAQALGLALGPTLGGILVQTVGWRWVFAINVPIAVIGIVAGRYMLPRTRLAARPQRVDVRTIVQAPGMARRLTGALLAYLLLFGPIVLVPAVLQDRGIGALQAGLAVAALPVGFALAAALGERVLPYGWSGTVRCLLGLAVSVAGLLSMIAAGPHALALVPGLVLVGAGIGLYNPANNAQIMGSVAPAVAGLAGGMVNTSRTLGTAAGTALVAGVFDAGGGLHATTLVLLGATAVCALFSWPTRPRLAPCASESSSRKAGDSISSASIRPSTGPR